MTDTQDQPPQRPAQNLPVALNEPLTDLDAAMRLSKVLAVASVLPYALQGKAADVLAIFMYGADIGLTPMQAIQGIYVVKGKPQLASQTWIGLANRAGHKVRMLESDDTRATVQIVSRLDPDYPHTETFTIEDAIKAGLCWRDEATGEIRARSQKQGKPEEILPWEKYTRDMLRNRAMSRAGKFKIPEVAMGFAIEGDYDYIDTDADEVEVTQPGMHQQPISAEDLQAAVVAAEAQYRQTDDTAADPNIHDAEVVDDPPAADTPTGPVDPEADLFAAADAQAERDLAAEREREQAQQRPTRRRRPPVDAELPDPGPDEGSG